MGKIRKWLVDAVVRKTALISLSFTQAELLPSSDKYNYEHVNIDILLMNLRLLPF
jgi:hypothetical protein